MILMSGHNVWFHWEISKTIFEFSSIPPLIWSSGCPWQCWRQGDNNSFLYFCTHTHKHGAEYNVTYWQTTVCVSITTIILKQKYWMSNVDPGNTTQNQLVQSMMIQPCFFCFFYYFVSRREIIFVTTLDKILPIWVSLLKKTISVISIKFTYIYFINPHLSLHTPLFTSLTHQYTCMEDKF